MLQLLFLILNTPFGFATCTTDARCEDANPPCLLQLRSDGSAAAAAAETSAAVLAEGKTLFRAGSRAGAGKKGAKKKGTGGKKGKKKQGGKKGKKKQGGKKGKENKKVPQPLPVAADIFSDDVNDDTNEVEVLEDLDNDMTENFPSADEDELWTPPLDAEPEEVAFPPLQDEPPEVQMTYEMVDGISSCGNHEDSQYTEREDEELNIGFGRMFGSCDYVTEKCKEACMQNPQCYGFLRYSGFCMFRKDFSIVAPPTGTGTKQCYWKVEGTAAPTPAPTLPEDMRDMVGEYCEFRVVQWATKELRMIVYNTLSLDDGCDKAKFDAIDESSHGEYAFKVDVRYSLASSVEGSGHTKHFNGVKMR
jgi:hypothetical protein